MPSAGDWLNPVVGWALAVAAVALGYGQWGWPGVAMAVTCVVFWLLLQFNRALRVMRQAANAPVGSVGSAVMLHAKLRPGMRLLDVIPLAGSLGRREVLPSQAQLLHTGDSPTPPPAREGAAHEVFVWEDASGTAVRLEWVGGRLRRWTLQRPPP